MTKIQLLHDDCHIYSFAVNTPTLSRESEGTMGCYNTGPQGVIRFLIRWPNNFKDCSEEGDILCLILGVMYINLSVIVLSLQIPA